MLAPPPPAPTSIRAASALCWLMGVLTILEAIVVGLPPASGPDIAVLLLGAYVIAGALVCGAAMLVRRQRRLSVLLAVLAWALPTVVGYMTDAPLRPANVMLFAAMLMLVANWKQLQ